MSAPCNMCCWFWPAFLAYLLMLKISNLLFYKDLCEHTSDPLLHSAGLSKVLPNAHRLFSRNTWLQQLFLCFSVVPLSGVNMLPWFSFQYKNTSQSLFEVSTCWLNSRFHVYFYILYSMYFKLNRSNKKSFSTLYSPEKLLRVLYFGYHWHFHWHSRQS